jgi:hypothetical protein
MPENYINNTNLLTLTTGINSTVTSLSTSALPVGPDGNFRILIDSEILFVNSGATTTTWNVARGMEGTVSTSHGAGAAINAVLTAGALDAIRAQINGYGTYISLPVSGMKFGDTYRTNDTGQTFIYNGSVWTPFYGIPSTACIAPANTLTGSNSGWQNYSALSCVSGSALFAFPSSWRMSMLFLAGSPVLGAIVVKRTLLQNTTVIDTTVVTIGGSATPTLTTPSYVLTDPINLQLDSSHDYWVIVFFTSAGANASVTATTGNSALKGGYYNNDATVLSTIPSIGGGSQLFIAPIMP